MLLLSNYEKMLIDNSLIYEWVKFLKNRDFSDVTIESYVSNFKLFVNWIRVEKRVFNVTEKDIRMLTIENRKSYLQGVTVPRTSIYYGIKSTLSRSTIQGKITAIKSFLKFLNCMYECGMSYRTIETKKIKSDYITSLTQAEFDLFLEFIGKYEKYEINRLRSQLMCNIGYTSGLRLSEMLSLRVEDVLKKEVRIVGKWGKLRWVFFTESTLELLRLYLEARSRPIPRTWLRGKVSDFVFISHNSGYDYGNVIKKNTCCEIIKRYSDACNMGKRITLHTFRHSYATRLLESWMNIREIQELLGHSDIKTTEGYCHVLKSNLKMKVEQIFV